MSEMFALLFIAQSFNEVALLASLSNAQTESSSEEKREKLLFHFQIRGMQYWQKIISWYLFGFLRY